MNTTGKGNNLGSGGSSYHTTIVTPERYHRLLAVAAQRARPRGDHGSPAAPATLARDRTRDGGLLPGRCRLRAEKRRSRSELLTTVTELKAIAPAANTGSSRIPKNGYSTPIATGMSTTL